MTGWELFTVLAVASAFPLFYLIQSWCLLPQSSPPADFGPESEAWIHPTANVYASTIGRGTKIAAFVEVGRSTVGPRCKIAPYASLAPDCRIGAEVFIGPGARLVNDRRPRATGEWQSQSVTVGDGASIGANAVILAGVTIGERAVIAAGAVVRKDVPAECTAVGNPARIIRRLPPGFRATD